MKYQDAEWVVHPSGMEELIGMMSGRKVQKRINRVLRTF
jgi:hypothetical protein